MQFGVQFFPDVRPQDRSAAQYFREALDISDEADRLGFTHIRIVEHYFHYYGGYSPNPIVFLAAAAQRTKRARLVTGAVLPAFNNPLKLAGEIAMLDAISGGRPRCWPFARAFLPHEFRRFGRSPDESVARYREGIEQVDLLLRREASRQRIAGRRLHLGSRIHHLAAASRAQKPRPKFYVAALNTPESFEFAGRMGYSVMAIAFVAAKMRPLLAAYRDAWKAAGHPGEGEVMIAFHMFCDTDGERARRVAAPLIDNYLHSLVDAASDWLDGRTSQDYPGYDKIIAGLRASNADDQMTTGAAAWVGTPDEIARTVATMQEDFGGFEHASLQVNFNLMRFEDAMASMRLFARRSYVAAVFIAAWSGRLADPDLQGAKPSKGAGCGG